MGTWPKKLPELTPEQRRIKDDFMRHWLEVLPRRYGLIERFNHGYPMQWAAPGQKTLEIGAGLGEHLAYEDLSSGEYTAVEFRPEIANKLKARFPQAKVLSQDCQKPMPLPEAHFDRVLAIHVLEHLPDLPAAIREIRRLIKPSGRLCAVIPCEGGLAYGLARRISAKRIFEKRYQMPYDWCIQSEHINMPNEILEELGRSFEIESRSFFPLKIPSVTFNLVIGLCLRPI